MEGKRAGGKKKRVEYFMVSSTQSLQVTIMLQNKQDFTKELLDKLAKHLQLKLLPKVLVDKPLRDNSSSVLKAFNQKEIDKHSISSKNYFSLTLTHNALRFFYYFTPSPSFSLLQRNDNDDEVDDSEGVRGCEELNGEQPSQPHDNPSSPSELMVVMDSEITKKNWMGCAVLDYSLIIVNLSSSPSPSSNSPALLNISDYFNNPPKVQPPISKQKTRKK